MDNYYTIILIYVITFLLSLSLYVPVLSAMKKNGKTVEKIMFIMILNIILPPVAFLFLLIKLYIEERKNIKNE